MMRSSTKTSIRTATMPLSLLLLASALLLPEPARAHEDPAGCFQTGPAITTSVFRADGTTGLVGSVSECETIYYQATLKKVAEDDLICAFSGGTFRLTTPDGVVHDIEADVPCIGGTIAPCDPSVDEFASPLIAYTVRPADVVGGLVTATATYTGGIAHDRDADTAGINATTPKATVVVLCDDGDACTQNVCDPALRGAEACSNPPVDCNDQNACTNDGCSEGACTHVAPDPTCVPCTTAENCDDQNACSADTCVAGVCKHTVENPTCVPCVTPAECGDGNACTTDLCTDGICTWETPDPTCVPCETAAECDDDQVCTTERCDDGICGHTAVPGCVPCETNEDCNDHDACTTDVCGESKSCQLTTIPGCVPCKTAADCNDGDACTADTCPAGACTHTDLAGCPAEICDDRVDNDGDGLVDCVDPDCIGTDACPIEICGNCIDDDGDGFVDYEDGDCCEQSAALGLKKMRFRTKPAIGKNRLRLKARFAERTPDGFEAGVPGTTLQLRDADGQFFCQTIPFVPNAALAKKGLFTFKDKTGSLAAGLRRARFRVNEKKGGRIAFRAKGKKMTFRDPVGPDVQVTIGVGAQCTRATATLKTKKVKTGQRLVFP